MNEPDVGRVDAELEQQRRTRAESVDSEVTDPDVPVPDAPVPHAPVPHVSAPRLNRGFDAYAHPAKYSNSSRPVTGTISSDIPSDRSAGADRGMEPLPYVPISRRDSRSSFVDSSSGSVRSVKAGSDSQRKRFGWLFPWLRRESLTPDSAPSPIDELPFASEAGLDGPPTPQSYTGESYAGESSPAADGISVPVEESESVHASGGTYRRAYSAIASLLFTGTAFTTAWFLGILAAQVLPGRFERPPIQESFLRKSSRLTNRLWHFSQLWHTPTNQIKIEAIPLPETGPLSEPLELSPIERQPLIDELNSIDTELLTLERRLDSIEKRLGNPLYEGADLEHRINSLRTAIDPPVRRSPESDYEPVASEPNETLLEVAALKITLPSDALFTPGQADLKAVDLLTQVLDQLVNYPDATISVRSYSDDQVDAIASRTYTLAQANALSRYLARALPGDYRWINLGMGQSEPVVPNEDAVTRQKNRRIEILVDVR